MNDFSTAMKLIAIFFAFCASVFFLFGIVFDSPNEIISAFLCYLQGFLSITLAWVLDRQEES